MAKDPTIIEEKEDEQIIEQAKAEEKTPEVAPARVEEYIRFNSGDTLEAIAKKYDTTVEKIIERNKQNAQSLQVGEWLYV